MFRELRERAYEANMGLVRHGLVIFTWGNASEVDREEGVVAIKPSGVEYDTLTPDDIVVLDLQTGAARFGTLRPSSDAPTHLALYRAFPAIGGVVHTHSRHATVWAQAGRDLPCLGTTHADYFFGPIPCTPAMTPEEIHGGAGYEHNTGEVIIREFRKRELDGIQMPAVLVRGHAPFTWGRSGAEALHNAVVLEEVARMAVETLALNPAAQGISQTLLDKHFLRKHGPGAYYGQNRL